MSDELRRAREAQGVTLEQVFERTRIPVKWLEALERGDVGAFPPGPFLSGYTKQYRSFLNLPAVSAALPEPARPLVPAAQQPPVARPVVPRSVEGERAEPGDPDPVGQVRRFADEPTITLTSPRARIRRAGRMGVAGLVAAITLLVALYFAQRVTPEEGEGVDIPPDQVLLVTSASGAHAKVEADGRELYDAALPPGRQLKFAAHDRLSVELEALEGVTLVYNGRTLKPLGAQSRARRLVFIDDHGG